MNRKAMLSQPMANKTEEEIVATRERAIKALEDMGYTVVNTLFTDEWYSPYSSGFLRKVRRKHGVLRCRILLQRLGVCSWLQAGACCR